MKKLVALCALVVCLGLFAVGCGEKPSTPAPSTTPAPSSTEKPADAAAPAADAAKTEEAK